MHVPRTLPILAAVVLTTACDGRPLLYNIVPSDSDREVLAAFRTIDTASSGQLTRAQADDYFKRRFSELDANRDGFLDEAELKGMVPIFQFKTAPAMLFSLDMKSAGRLSRDDFLRLSVYLFTRDTNRDGILTLAEVKTPPTDGYVASGGAVVTDRATGLPQ
jgi:Ca2+-binding EF-hand superfamily protein